MRRSRGPGCRLLRPRSGHPILSPAAWWIGRPRKAAMAEIYDAIIIGAGHNGLFCAAYSPVLDSTLSRSAAAWRGLRDREVWPGYRGPPPRT